MDRHYNAFISYRHHPDDIRAATQIHRALERFRVPKALRKTIQLPMRLFRDKDELPITSNLSDDIFQALRNSDFLIVICSVHTKESQWVQREIETFLQTHSRNQVLTVLVSGEPYDVIPEILLYEEQTDPITGEIRKIPMEPLSCDWRMGHKKAMREELPRLAAALLHCGYDELRQRQRQYQMKRLIAVFSAALILSLGLAVYFLYTSITIRNANIQIQENLDQALQNQSRNLATSAQDYLDNGDRLTAIALLLEALPGTDNPRPYVAEAEHTLAQALGVYSSEDTPVALGALTPSETAEVLHFLVTDDHNTVYLVDSRYMVTVWDADTMSPISTIDTEASFVELLDTTASSNILINASDRLQCYSPQGTLLWKLDRIQDIAVSYDKTTVFVLAKDSEGNRVLHTLNADTGAALCDPLLILNTPDGAYPSDFCLDYIPDNMPLPVIYWNIDRLICLLDPETGGTVSLFETEHLIHSSCITEDGKLIFVVSDGSGYYNGLLYGTRTSSPSRSDIYAYDIYTGELLWKSEIQTCQYSHSHYVDQVPGTDYLFCQEGNTLQLLDIRDGTLIQRCDAVGGILEIVRIYEDSVLGMLEDGSVFSYDFYDNECNAYDYNMEGSLKEAYMGGGTFTLSYSSNHVTLYNYADAPALWNYEMDYVYTSDMRKNGDTLLLRTQDHWNLLDLNTQRVYTTIPKEYMQLLDLSDNGTCLWAMDGYNTVISIHTETGSKQKYELPTSVEGAYYSISNDDPVYIDGDFWYFMTCGRDFRLFRYSPEDNTLQTYPIIKSDFEIPDYLNACANSDIILQSWLEERNGLFSQEDFSLMEKLLLTLPEFLQQTEQAQIIAIENGYTIIRTGTGDVYEVNLESGTCAVRATGMIHPAAWALRESDGALAVAQEKGVLVFIPGGETLLQISLDSESPGALSFYGEELLVLCDSANLLRFDETGTRQSRTSLGYSDTFVSNLKDTREPLDITWSYTEDRHLIINMFSIISVIDCETWGTAATFPNCILYDETRDQFIIRGENGLLAYPRYKTQELIDLAHQVLGNFTLSQKQKDAYGIE